MSVLLELRGLTVRGPDRVLVEGIDVTVRAGQVTALCGPSGAGKSLTARVCLGVVDVLPGVTAGSLRLPEVGGHDWLAGYLGGGERAWRRLHLATRPLRGSYLSYAPQAASSALLAEVGLSPAVARALPAELSGGQNQRAAVAVAMACSPRVLVADEPETGLDPLLRRQVVELLVRVARAHDCGLLLISHHEDTVERLADLVVRLTPPARAA